MVARSCKASGIPTTLGELLQLPTKTFRMLVVTLNSLSDRQEWEKVPMSKDENLETQIGREAQTLILEMMNLRILEIGERGS